ncbi:hypothetical protein E2C01_056624 [Portunus trituberculatus]|uniref:Uncharacterized protein n=1 Tax=Portunus trituberculatus TaxID=210409 RepID=A0A5B7H034_PORTR|nr:hypothetical protein [Portunus trituberculatus]
MCTSVISFSRGLSRLGVLCGLQSPRLHHKLLI